MPIDKDSGLVEPDITINGHVLTFAECMAVRVAISSFRISLTAPSMRAGLGELATNYDRLLVSVERSCIATPNVFETGDKVIVDCDQYRGPGMFVAHHEESIEVRISNGNFWHYPVSAVRKA